MRVARRAYAKVNLALAVGAALPAGDAAAGMHPIESWMHCVDLADDVVVEIDCGNGRVVTSDKY